MNLKKSILFIFICLGQMAHSQEGLAVYSDYLSDNLYLIHPSMAGAANCGKVRLTGRQQWFGQENAPALQTLSFNNSLSDQSGIGAIVFNDRNGFHSQAGAKLTYAHHLRFSRSTVDLNQLSFGINAAFIQSKLDGTRFTGFDPSIVPGVIQKDAYFNVDLGVSYYLRDFFTHFTVNNFLETRREIYAEDYESDNVRKYLWSVGGILGNSDKIMWEPSLMFQYIEETTEKTLDVNMKAYKNMNFGRLWAGVSYRTAFDATQYTDANGLANQTLQYITPIIGVNYEKYMFAYTYSKIIGDVQFDNGGFHQLTLGIDIFCKDKLYDCNCPAVN